MEVAMSTAGTAGGSGKEPAARYAAALVTGATSGIGEAIARALPAETSLWLTGRDEARLAALADELGRGGRTVATLAADLALRTGQETLIDWAGAAPLDLLVNNAGFGRYGSALEAAGLDRAMVEVNLLAPMALTQGLLPGMLERARAAQRRAGIINVASMVGFFPWPWFTSYAATKAFLLSWTLGLVAELNDEPVDLLALCPGSTATRFHERAGYARALPWPGHSSERVAREALAALGRKPVLVVGGRNRLATFVMRYLPRRFTLPAMARVTARNTRL
jgi:short-subunit dehydrogenase